MFSNLTSQVSGWMGKKGEGEGEKPEDGAPPSTEPQPEENPPAEDSTGDAAKKDASPTKGGSRLEMLGNLGGLGGSVKSQMSSWLGGGIPGLNKKPEAAEGDAPADAAATTPPAKSPSKEKDDDASSATGSADSEGHVDSIPTTPTDDKEGGQTMGAVSTKAIAGAKSFGNFLYSAVNKAGKSVTEASAKIKKTVEENSILGEFNKEQEAFIKDNLAKGGGAAVAPWIGCPNQEALKEECLSLSTDRRNFVRAPPEGVDFTFDYETQFPVCQAILAEDPNLEKMRFDLVPKVISEENFWRNYLYRVNLICQANEVSSMVQESGGGSVDRTNSQDGQAPETAASPEELGKTHDLAADFVNDFATDNPADLEEVKESIKKLGLGATDVTEEEWERELEAELQDYEMVGGGDDKSIELLDSDLTDLK
ncbi:synapse-associated protein [Nesidiocoris tenuis]|uniref:Synapse-associated protein n=1 Tax=Nesidiocoris tenuis TaxID=355587 RepID=A0ABN7AR23_9HEMI|nr:synapse-associated protein [Nesidiocoris tenuis]